MPAIFLFLLLAAVIGFIAGRATRTCPTATVKREANSYSKLGVFMIEHESPGDAQPWTVYPVCASLLNPDGPVGFSFSTRAEAEEFANRLEK